MAVLGPGTGPGRRVPRAKSGGETVIASEGGHATLPATCRARGRHHRTPSQSLRSRFGGACTFRRRPSSTSTRRSRRSINYPWPEGARRASPRARSRAVVPYAVRRSSCPARRRVRSREMSPSLSPRRAASLSAVELRRESSNISRDWPFRTRFRKQGTLGNRYLANIATSVIVRREPTFLGSQRLAKMTLDRSLRAGRWRRARFRSRGLHWRAGSRSLRPFRLDGRQVSRWRSEARRRLAWTKFVEDPKN